VLELLDDSVEAEDESISMGELVAMRISEEEMEIGDDETTKKPRHLSEKK
jgi:hypothetical protein